MDDPERVVFDGFSATAGDLLTVIVLVEDDAMYGVNAWRSNARDRRIYLEGTQ